MAKIKRKRQHTIVTFVMEGRLLNNAVTISFIPGFLEIIFRGLSALKALNALSDYKLL